MDITVNGCVVTLEDLGSIISYKKKMSQTVFNLKRDLQEKQSELKRVETYLRCYCNHSWVTDSIDSMKGYKQGIIIKYCENCELNFN